MQNLFEGHLVRLRALEPGDAETLFRHHQDTEIARRDARIQWPRSLAAIRQRLENRGDGQATDDIELAITTLENQLVGGIDVQSTDRRNGTFSISGSTPLTRAPLPSIIGWASKKKVVCAATISRMAHTTMKFCSD